MMRETSTKKINNSSNTPQKNIATKNTRTKKTIMINNMKRIVYRKPNSRVNYIKYKNQYISIKDYKKYDIPKILNPTDVLLRDFYKYMFETWPNCYPFKELPNKKLQPMSCMSTITIPPDSSITSCEKYDVKNEVSIKVVFGKLDKMKETWFDDYDCFSCEHMQRCSMGCFANHLRSCRTQKKCWLKEVYDHVDNKV
jgi:radical SAM protein with 4Fe4S-binding SPASM domain